MMNTTGSMMPASSSVFWNSSPLAPGNLTSSTMQPAASGRLLRTNSCVDANACTLRPTERSRSATESRTVASSSITYVTGCSSVMSERRRQRSYHFLAISRQAEPEDGAVRRVGLGPQTSAVRLDDGSADGEPDSHALRLGGVEGFEKPFGRGGIQPDPRISDGNERSTLSVGRRGNRQF